MTGESGPTDRGCSRARASSSWIAALCACLAWLSACDGPHQFDCEDAPSDVFERRIEPIFSADRPDTCAQCHVGSISLSDFIRRDACESMACLKEQGLVDLDDPENSIILTFIERAEPDSSLITQNVIRQEHQAFLDWIQHEAACGGCEGVDCPLPPSPLCDEDEERTDFDLSDCSPEELEEHFRAGVYRYRERCSPCHFEEEETATDEAPRWLTATGTCQIASLNTMRRVIAGGYIDVESPTQSLILLKPLPEYQGGVPHLGHDKIVEGDAAYQSFLGFLEHYANCEEAAQSAPTQ